MLLLKSISNTDTTLSVTVDAAMPASNGVIQIGSERIIYDDNYMGTLYGCLRGAQSTVAAPHILGTTVSLVNFYSAFPGTPDVSSASNVGTGEGTFAQKVLDDLQFKSLVEGTNVTITSTPTEITIASTDTGEVNTASNVGSGAGLFAQKILADLQFKSLTAGTNIVLTPSTDDITVTLTDSITLLAGTESAPAIQVSDGLGSGGGMYANDAYSGNPGLALSYLDTGTYYTGLVVNPNGVQIIDKNGAGSATIYFWPLNNTLPEASSLSRSTVGLFSLNNTELVDGTPDIRLLINQEGDYPIEFHTNNQPQVTISSLGLAIKDAANGSPILTFWPTTLVQAGYVQRDQYGRFDLANTDQVDGAPDIRIMIAQYGDYPIEFWTNSILQTSVTSTGINLPDDKHLKLNTAGDVEIFYDTGVTELEIYFPSAGSWAIRPIGGTDPTMQGTATDVSLFAGVALLIADSGTAANPIISIGNDGIFSATAGAISISTSTQEVARFDDSAVAGDTRFMLWDVDSGALVRVSVGADDSAGVGYKVLRVPN